MAASGRGLDARSRGVPPAALAFRRNEAKVGCQTIVYFTDAAARLGASDSQAQQLYPYGLALYDLELDLYPWHRDPKCVVPPWLPPSAP